MSQRKPTWKRPLRNRTLVNGVEVAYTPGQGEYRRYRKRYWGRGGRNVQPVEGQITITLRPVREIQEGCKQKGRLIGKTQDVFGLQEFTALLLWNNEHLPRSQKMTDEIMVRILGAEFPHSSLVQKLVRGKKKLGVMRSYYNHGDMTGGVPPTVKSYRYTEKGERANLRTGKPLRLNQGRVRKRKPSVYRPEGGKVDPRLIYGPAVDGAYDGSEGD